MNSMSAADVSGVTYRQLDHWIRKGYIRGALPGSGFQRDLNGHEVEVLKIMADLVTCLAMRPARAAVLARTLAGGKAISVGSYLLVRAGVVEVPA